MSGSLPAAPVQDGRTIVERARAGATLIVRPLIAQPMREGRLRLTGLGRLDRQMTICGLVALLALLGSMLFVNTWRHGELIFVRSARGRFLFIPSGLIPVTLLAFFVSWAVLSWGALRAHRLVRVGLAVAFLLVHASLGQLLTVELEVARFEVIPWLVRGGYFVVPSLLIVDAILDRTRGPMILHRTFRVSLPIGLLAFFAGLQWVHVLQLRHGIAPNVPLLLSATFSSIEKLLLPLIAISGIGVISFSRGVASTVTAAVHVVRAGAARVLLLTLIATKLWIQFARHAGNWRDIVTLRPMVAVTTSFVALIAGAATMALARHPRSPSTAEHAKERLVYVAAFALSIPFFIVLARDVASEALIVQMKALGAARALGDLPLGPLSTTLDACIWLALLAWGLMRLRQARNTTGEVAIGYVILGAWAGTLFGLELMPYQPVLDVHLLDIVLTAAIGSFLTVRWREINGDEALRLLALVLFLWLVLTEGKFIAGIGAFIGLPSIVVIVIGTLYTLLTGSSFASRDSARFPRPARALLWIGYLILSATIVHWVMATHAIDVASQDASRSFFYIGIPMAFWMLTRMSFVERDEVPGSTNEVQP